MKDYIHWYQSQGFKALRCKGYNPRFNPAKDYSIAKQAMDGGFTRDDFKGLSLEEIEEWTREEGWLGWVIPEGYIVIDVEDKESIKYMKFIYDSLKIIPPEHNSNKGKHFFHKFREALSAASEVYTKCGMKVTYRVGHKNYLILAPTNGREWAIEKPLHEAPELPVDLQPYDNKNTDDILSVLSWQVGVAHRKGLLHGYDDIDTAFMTFLIECGLSEKQIHDSFFLIFPSDYDEGRTQMMYERAKARLDSGEIIRGTGTFIHRIRELGLKEIERFCRELQRARGSIKGEEPSSTDIVDCVKNATALINTTKDISWVVYGLLPRKSVSIFSGAMKDGKTWVVLEVGTAVSAGRDVFNTFPSQKGRVLFIEGDVPDEIVKWRLQNADYTYEENNFLSINKHDLQQKGIDLDLSTQKGQELFERLIRQKQPDLIIIDSLTPFYTADENKAAAMKPIMTFLAGIAGNYNLHILIVHHMRKRQKKEEKLELSLNEVIGTNVILRLASIIFGVQKRKSRGIGGGQYTIATLGSWFKPIRPVAFDINETKDGKVSIDWKSEEKIPDNKTEYATFMIEKLLETHGPVKRSEIIFELQSISQSTIDRALARLVEAGRITREGVEHSPHTIYSLAHPE